MNCLHAVCRNTNNYVPEIDMIAIGACASIAYGGSCHDRNYCFKRDVQILCFLTKMMNKLANTDSIGGYDVNCIVSQLRH